MTDYNDPPSTPEEAERRMREYSQPYIFLINKYGEIPDMTRRGWRLAVQLMRERDELRAELARLKSTKSE